MSFFVKNITNLNSIGVGLYPAVANLNMAGNSIVHLNQINGQTFPATAGVSGTILHIGPTGNMYWDVGGVGPSGPVGPTGPAQAVGGICGEITFNWDLNGDGIGESVGDPGLTYDWCGQTVNAYTLNLTKNLSVGSNVTVIGKISSGPATSNSIGNVTLQSGSIRTQPLTTNAIGAWTLTASNFYSPSMTINTSGSIYTPASISSSIAGVYMSNSTLSAANSTVGGVTLSGNNVTASSVTVNGTVGITGVTTISALLTVSSLWVQNALSVSGVSTLSSAVVLNSLSANSLYSTTTIGAAGALTISGLATLSGVWVQNALNVSGVSTLSSAIILNSLSANSVYSTTTIGAGGALNISGLATLSGLTVQNNLSLNGTLYGTTANLSALTGLKSINSIPVTIDSANSIILAGVSIQNLCGTNIVALGTAAALNNSGSYVVAFGASAAVANTGSNVVAIGRAAGLNNSGGSSAVFIGSNAGNSNSGSDVVSLGTGAGASNSGSNVIAIGSSAGKNNSGSNMIFLGSPLPSGGTYTPVGNNVLLVYSTSDSFNPFLYGDLSGKQLGIGKTPSAALDVQGSGLFSGSVSASSAFIGVGGLNVSGSASLNGGATVSGTVSTQTISATYGLIATLSATTLNVSGTLTTTTLNVCGSATLSGANITNTLATQTLSATYGLVGTLSATTLNVSGALTTTTLNVCGLATISSATITNTLVAQTLSAAGATITTLSATTLNVSALSTLYSLSVQTISAGYAYAPGATITTLSATTANVSGILTAVTLNVCGLATLSGATVSNTLTTQTLSAAGATITTLSATTLNVSGLSTLYSLSVQTISAAYIYVPAARITTLSANNVNISGSLTVAGDTVFPNLSGLVTFDGVPVLIDNVKQYICIGISTGISGGATDVNAYGFGAGSANSGQHVNAYGLNAAKNNSGPYVNAFGSGAAASNTADGLIAIGRDTGASNSGLGAIAIGVGACTTNSGDNVIGIGSNALYKQGGSNVIGIGINAGYSNTASGSIFIGSNAGSNARYPNALVLGNNPFGGYTISAANTFLVYSTVSSKPFLQGDMSSGFFGIGKTPLVALDVVGSGIFSSNLTVSAGTTTLSLALITTLSATNAVVTALTSTSVTTSAAVVQGTLSASNVNISGPGGQGLTIANNGTFTMGGTFSNTLGTTNLGTTTIAALNGVNWPAVTGTQTQILTISSAGIAAWTTPAAVSLAGWWNVTPTANLNMGGNGITNLSSINGVPIVFSETPQEVVGIGYGTLSGVTGNEIFAVGRNAGLGAGGTNLIYLGSNPGGVSPLQSNFFTMYSTTSGLPFLQGDLSGMRLGIGKNPSVALDVSGSATITGSAFNVCSGLATLSSVWVVNSLNVSGQANFSNAAFTTLSASNVSVYTGGTLNVSGSTSLTGLQASTISGSSLYSSGGLKVDGTSTLQATTVATTLGVTGVTTLGTLGAGAITGTSVYSTGTLRSDGTTTLQATTVATTLGVTGTTTLGTLGAGAITGTSVSSTGTLTANGLTTLSATVIGTTLNVSGLATLSAATINGTLTVCGQTAFTNLSFAKLNGITWTAPVAGGGTVLTYNSTNGQVLWDTYQHLGLSDWALNPATSTVSLANFGLTGITSFNNISAVFNSSPFQIGLGPNVLRSNTQANIIALGISAGAVGGNTTGVGPNCIFLGSNPGGSSNVSNSLVVYSQIAGSPLIYGDLSTSRVTIGGQTNTGGYTLNVNGSALAQSLNSPASSSNSIGGVTMCNSILSVGTISGVTSLNGQTVVMNGTTGLIGIGPAMGLGGTSNIALGNFAGYGYSQTGDSEGGQLIAIGGSAGYGSSGSSNTLLGYHAGQQNTGSFVNAIGRSAGESNTGSYVNGVGGGAVWQNAASYVDAMGYQAGQCNAATGSNLVAIGSNAGYGNKGASNIYIGSGAGSGSAITNVSCAIVIGANAGVGGGFYGVGVRSVAIGSNATGGATDAIALGTSAWAGNTAGIAIGANAGYNGTTSIVIGSNSGLSPNTYATNVIALGTNAASNIPALNNTIYIGSNAGYNPTTANSLVVQSLVSTAPTLQADLSNRWLGVGKVPGAALDVAGSVMLTGGTVTLSATTITTNLTVCGTTTLSGKTVIANLSATNTTISGTLNVTGSASLSGLTLNVLNSTPWPSSIGTGNQLLAMNPAGTAAVWTTPGAVDSAQWASNAAVSNVNIAGFDMYNIVSLNTIPAVISTTQIGLGPKVLTNNTAASVVAFGSNAGSNATANSTFTNCVYLGSNPGTNATASNTFLVYSTTAGVPALQVNTGNSWLGVGMVPTTALDVTGNGRISGTLTTQSKLVVGNFSTSNPSNYAMNIVASGSRTGYITWYSNTNQVPYIGLGFDQTNDGIGITSNTTGGDLVSTNAFFVSRGTGRVGIGTSTPAVALDVVGQINTNTAITTPSLAVSASTTLLGTLTLPTIASTAYASKVLSYNSSTGAVNYSTLNLGTLGGADSNTMNANWVTSGGGTITWNGATNVVSGTQRIIAIPVNNAMASYGFLNIAGDSTWSITMNAAGWSAAYWVPNSIPSEYGAGSGSVKVVQYGSVGNQIGSNWIFICATNSDTTNPPTLKWGPGFITIPSGGVYNSVTGGTSWNVLGQATNIALGSNSSITGGTSIVIGSNATSAVAANNVIAIGTNAGSNLPNLNNTIYIGSNAGYAPTTSNTLVVQSTSSTAPTLQADLANRWLGVGMVPSNALDVAGTIRASGPVISTLSVSGTSAAALTLTTTAATTYFSLASTATAFSLTFPATAPPTGTYWVLKNNSTVNYTITATNGVFNGGTTSTYFLQAGIGVTLAYSGTGTAYYTF